MLYFGYGSNLDPDHWRAWCRERGFDPSGLVPRCRGFLPDYELVFRRASRRWGGGAADLRARPGSAVPGVIFEADSEAMRALDAKEGSGSVYERITAVALDDEGSVHEVVSYQLLENRRVPDLAPSDLYLATILRGLEAFGLPTEPLERAAMRGRAEPALDHVFVYGTLLRGGRSHHRLVEHGAERVAPATIAGRLYNLGRYPGLVRGMDPVRGELYRIRDAAVFATLDAWEDFDGYGAESSSYLRVVREVTSLHGPPVWAWVYRYVGDLDAASLIPSGDWRDERGPFGDSV